MIALLLALILDDPAPRPPRQEEPVPRPGLLQEEPPPPRLEDDAGGGFLDFDWLELQFRTGFAVFSEDYRSDPCFQASLGARVPMPWLTPRSSGEYFGAFVGAGFIAGVDRDLDPPPSGADGNVFFVNAGVDFTLLRNQSLYLVLEAGGQYTNYGGIDGLDDGLATLAGVNFGLYVGGGVTATIGEQTVFGNGGDRMYLLNLGLVIEF